MLRIEVKDQHVDERSGTAKASGRPYVFREQKAWLHGVKAYPVEAKISLDKDQAPFPAGDYTLSEKCFYLNRYGEVQVDLRHMQPRVSEVRRTG